MVRLARLLVAAPSTGSGKTTIATGLMAALRAAGHQVSGHKVGPDYIDPGYHALATGRPGRNLDPHLVGEEQVVPLLLHGAHTPAPADIAVIEGVMGLHDGRLGTDGFASSAHVAALTSTPVLLVLDVARMSRSAAAIAAGMATFDPQVRVGGVVLNRAGSDRNTAEITRALDSVGLPVLGRLPHDEELATPSRHLGLVPVAERDASVAMVERLGAQVAEHLDLDAIAALAASAPDLDAEPWRPALSAASQRRPVVAMAGGRSFTFRYAETEELLRSAGCEVVTLDPLTDPVLPENISALYLGGGFPEVYAAELAANTSLLDDLRTRIEAGLPTVAECAGLLYLAATLDATPMAGIVPADAAMAPRLTLRYPVATAVGDTLLTKAGEQVTAHEFHRTATVPAAPEPADPRWSPAWEVNDANVAATERVGFASDTVHASYLHLHWAGQPQVAQRFADAAHAYAARADASGGTDVDRATADPLRHHGDVEATPGLLDLAVNVYPGPRPAWLDEALHASIDASAAYPDVSPARAGVAAHHRRSDAEVLLTAGAAEAFTLVARLRPWHRAVVVHPQFTEPHAALEAAGHRVTTVLCRAEDGFALDPTQVPDDADLVVLGNPTNPTGVLHPASVVRALARPGRLVVVDEAFMDAVPGEPESLAGKAMAGVEGMLVIRSLTKHWSIPGIRAGYVLGEADTIAALAAIQSPWSVSAPAIAAAVACTGETAAVEAARRAEEIGRWRDHLVAGLRGLGLAPVASAASFVLVQVGVGVHAALRDAGIAVRRADTFPGLDGSWVRIAVREPAGSDRLCRALRDLEVPR
ncbi:cobyrinate a,c-diamide synthase [Nocardioides sp.]|uniref:cobyrinate a,c-diamide synthase n=1 Tax=Nocardioides sp. TaxID=35761 RepID=UPI0026242DB3|nr:cobyrinate a,c-diamide synthase [Nocardioides sp.]